MPLFDATTEQLKNFIPGLTINFDARPVGPELELAQDAMLVKFLGEEVTQQLIDLTEQTDAFFDDPANRFLKRALYLAQVAVARVGFASYLVFGEVQIGDEGITTPSGADRKAAFEYQTKALKRSLTDSGWRALDELIALVAANPDQFEGWQASPFYQEHQDAIFKNAAEFSKYYPIQDRWLTFWALRPFIQPLETGRGQSSMAQIDELSANDALKADLKKGLLRALALQSVLDAIPFLSITLDGANVQVNYASQYANIDYHTPPSKEQLIWVQQNLQRYADLAWSSFDTKLTALTNPSADSSTDPGLITSSGAVTML